jgi:hypothetical protein
MNNTKGPEMQYPHNLNNYRGIAFQAPSNAGFCIDLNCSSLQFFFC